MNQELNSFEQVLIICPSCGTKKKLKIPIKVINQSKQLTTVSIPAGICCDHCFQAFIDKDFKVRGYQPVDFDFSKVEFFEEPEEARQLIPRLDVLINLLRSSVDDNEIIGSALFNIEGKIIYSSLPTDSLFTTIREFEVRNEENLTEISRSFLVLENNQMVCSKFIQIKKKK